jgi:hypothetical protein
MSTDHAVFVLEKLKIIARAELEQRIEKHLKDEFYHKWLPRVKKEVTNKLVVDLVNMDDMLEIQMRIKEDVE